MEEDIIAIACKECGNQIKAIQRWTPGGMNDKGGWILECRRCGKIFDLYVGKDINDSTVLSGAKVIETYDADVQDRDSVLRKHALL